MRKIITIDGTAGAGKGSVCQLIVADYPCVYLDSGIFYRLIGHFALTQKTEALPDLLAYLSALNLTTKQGDFYANGVKIGTEIRNEAVASMSSKIAKIGEIRSLITEKCRQFEPHKNLVTDGRDMGTVVFPDAHLKIFLSASPEARAERRVKQLKEQGEIANIEQILQDIVERDQRDSNRAIAPLKPASDAVILDTSALTLNQVYERVKALLNPLFF